MMKAKFLALVLVAAISIACSRSSSLPDDGFVDVTGGRIAFRVIGGSSSAPVLLIHGGPGSSSCSYVANMGGIAATRPVILYDQLGSGWSDRISDLEKFARLPRFVEEIDAIRNELGLEQIHLVGHSWGAMVALEYLLTAQPKGVKSTVFVSPYFGTDRWVADTEILAAELPAEAREAINRAIESGDFESSDFEAADKVWTDTYGLRTPREMLNLEPCDKKPSGYSGLYEYMWGPSEILITGTLKDHDLIGQLPMLDLPVLFVVGQYDEVRTETMLFYQQQVDGSKLEILPDAGHMVHLDQTELFNKALSNFFDEVEIDR